MKKIILLLVVIFLITSCNSKKVSCPKYDVLDYFRKSYVSIENEKNELDKKSLENYYETLSDEEKIGQLFFVSMDGKNKDNAEYIRKVNKKAPGGYLLFSINIPKTADETIDFTSAIYNEFLKNEDIPPYIGIDHEGGSVNRLRTICSKLPSQKDIALKFSKNEAERLYELQGIQLKNIGINVNLAPVVEILTEENIEFLDDRSYGNKNDVFVYSKAHIDGMINSGILPVLKHFPGNTNNDPHTGIPVLKCDLKTLQDNYLSPFETLLNGKETAVLIAHTIVPVIDEKPSCLSEKVVNLLGKNATPYEGLIFSDDLLMSALSKNGYSIESSLIDAVNAGINILMIASCVFDDYSDIIMNEYRNNTDFKEKVDKSVIKILEWKVSCNLLTRTYSQNGFFTYSAEIHLPSIVTDEHIEIRKKKFEKAYTEAADLYNEIWWSR